MLTLEADGVLLLLGCDVSKNTAALIFLCVLSLPFEILVNSDKT